MLISEPFFPFLVTGELTHSHTPHSWSLLTDVDVELQQHAAFLANEECFCMQNGAPICIQAPLMSGHVGLLVPRASLC